MQQRQLWMVNTVLAVLAVALGWRLAAGWESAEARLARLNQAVSAPSNATVAVPPPAFAASTSEIVANNLFSPDRRSEAPQETAAPTAMPAMPVIFGTMKLGEGYEALMTEAGQAAGQRFRRVKVGEQFGGFIVEEIRDDTVVVEYRGQKTSINVYQSAKSARAAAPPPSPPAAGAPAARQEIAPVVESAGSAADVPPPPNTFPARQPGAQAGAQLPPGVRMTIEGNRRRFERDTPFGPQVWYEEIPR